MLSYAPKTYQHEHYKKKSNYLRDVTHLLRDKEQINILQELLRIVVCRMYGTYELKMVGKIMRGIRVEWRRRLMEFIGEKE